MIAYDVHQRIAAKLFGRKERLVLRKAVAVLGLIACGENKRCVGFSLGCHANRSLPAAGVVYQNVFILGVARSAYLRIGNKDKREIIFAADFKAFEFAPSTVFGIRIPIGFIFFKSLCISLV